ncbi:MAG: hypothetical protein H6708_14540 [Kofleriaceae bacterium]|nr:hypothetical protein [Kofleriaceae bacterium]
MPSPLRNLRLPEALALALVVLAACAGCGEVSDAGPDAAAADPDAATTDGGDGPPTQVLVTLVSHNEDTRTGANPACTAFFGDLAGRYAANRAAVLAIADLVVAGDAAWDFESDAEYLDAVAAREPADDNVVRTLATRSPAHIVVDAHAHESPVKNYADVANQVEALAGVRTGVIGGYLVDPCDGGPPSPDWEKFRAPLTPAGGGAALTATVLALGASPGHRCDPPASGVWRPASHAEPFRDDPTQTLPAIGPGLSGLGLVDGLAAIRTLVADLRAGRLEPHRLYTASVTIPQCDFDLADGGVTPTDVAAFIDAVNAEVATGDVAWATFPDIVATWRADYGAAPSLWTGE